MLDYGAQCRRIPRRTDDHHASAARATSPSRLHPGLLLGAGHRRHHHDAAAGDQRDGAPAAGRGTGHHAGRGGDGGHVGRLRRAAGAGPPLAVAAHRRRAGAAGMEPGAVGADRVGAGVCRGAPRGRFLRSADDRHGRHLPGLSSRRGAPVGRGVAAFRAGGGGCVHAAVAANRLHQPGIRRDLVRPGGVGGGAGTGGGARAGADAGTAAESP